MKCSRIKAAGVLACVVVSVSAAGGADWERTCFQTARSYSGRINLGSDVAIVYGIDQNLPDRIRSWRDQGYRIHVMTGVSWGNYQDYLYGRFDGTNHVDEAQTERNGKKISHGGDVYYMCPGENFGKFLSVGVQRALDAGAEAIHLEEPEFWVRGGYSEAFKREWQRYYNEPWKAPHESVDGQWRASKLKYYLYRRALQQVFDHVQAFNQRTGKNARCYVPTHSLLNYAHWRIVSPESSLARLEGCDGYIAQVWTGTSRTPNVFRGRQRERTFETAFLEYGAMQNLVRATGRRVWYLNDPVEDNPNHDWDDYRSNWESTLTASLLQPDVWRYEVMPWPHRIWTGRYPVPGRRGGREGIPDAYATELQTVINTLNDLRQSDVAWDAGTARTGVMISDSLMFERGEPEASDAHMSHIYGMALPLLKRGMPVEPVQLETAGQPGFLNDYDLLLMTYRGMKPLSPEVHSPLVDWVKAGGMLVFCDDDGDPYNQVREWWNQDGNGYDTPRQHLFELLGVGRDAKPGRYEVGKGVLLYRRQDPGALARERDGDQQLCDAILGASSGTRVHWKQTNYLLLRRGPYWVGAGLDESSSEAPRALHGAYLDLFDPKLPVKTNVTLDPGKRVFLLDLDRTNAMEAVLAASAKTEVLEAGADRMRVRVEGIADSPGIAVIRVPKPVKSATLGEGKLEIDQYDADRHLVWVTFQNTDEARELVLEF